MDVDASRADIVEGLKTLGNLRGEYVWRVENLSSIGDGKLYSPRFDIGGFPWQLLLFPRGNPAVDQPAGSRSLSLFLQVGGDPSTELGLDEKRKAVFTLHLIRQRPKTRRSMDVVDAGMGEGLENDENVRREDTEMVAADEEEHVPRRNTGVDEHGYWWVLTLNRNERDRAWTRAWGRESARSCTRSCALSLSRSLLHSRSHWHSFLCVSRKSVGHEFSSQSSDWGYNEFIALPTVYDENEGFVVDDSLVIKAEVQVGLVGADVLDSRTQTGGYCTPRLTDESAD
jgi:hypothetical protein